MIVSPRYLLAPLAALALASPAPADEWSGLCMGGRAAYLADLDYRAAFNRANPGVLPETRRPVPSVDAPAFDWTEVVKPGPVHTQNSPNCWAIATIAAFEYSRAIRNGAKEMTRLTAQPILDRTGKSGGQDMPLALQDLVAHGTCKSDAYPYTGRPGRLRADVAMPYRLAAWGYVDGDATVSVRNIKRALVDHGPVVAGLQVTPAFLAYRGGVFAEHARLPDSAVDRNHGVVIVGWNDRLGKAGAWKVQNSWGTRWGVSGVGWIEYDCNKVGFAACWMRAQADQYRLPDTVHWMGSPNLDAFPARPDAKAVNLVPKQPYPRTALNETGKNRGELVALECTVRFANFNAGDLYVELSSDENVTDRSGVIVRIMKPELARSESEAAGRKAYVEQSLQRLVHQYQGRRVRVQGLLQGGLEVNDSRSHLVVWDPKQVELLP